MTRRSWSLHLLSVLIAIGSISAGEPVDLEFTAEVDGSSQRYVIVEPQGFDSKRNMPVPLLIALHGHGSDRWQFVKDGRDECRAARDAAAKFGMLYVSPDYRARTSWMGPKAEADLVQIVREIKSRYEVSEVVICGGSMGGTSALTFAALHPELVNGVVAFNGTANLMEYERFQDAIAASYGGSKQDVPEEYRKRSAELHFERLTMPVATTTGGRDEIVPPDSVLRMMEKLGRVNSRTLSIHRPEGGHSTDAADSRRALEFVIKQAIAPR